MVLWEFPVKHLKFWMRINQPYHDEHIS
jgi:hypothetical protein